MNRKMDCLCGVMEAILLPEKVQIEKVTEREDR